MGDTDGLDYLMPTCMQGRRAHPWSMHYGSTSFSGSPLADVYDDSLKALDTDTCSEVSDLTYADASYYTKMKLSRPLCGDSCESMRLVDSELGSRFSRSLKQFLEWPDPSVSAETEIDAAIRRFECREGLKSKRRYSEARRRSEKWRSQSARRATCIPKQSESDTDYMPESDHYDSDGSDVKLSKTFSEYENINSEILRHNLVKPKVYLEVPKQNKCFDSDSDYKTLSDTSSEKIEHTFAKFGDGFVDLTHLREELVSVTRQAESFVSKLSSSKVFQFTQKTDLRNGKTSAKV